MTALRRSILTALLLAPMAHSQPSMIVDSITTQALGTTRTFGVLLPGGYDPSRRYPILYLLHGHDGSYRDWNDRTSISSTMRDIPIIIVLPDADYSWYVNSHADTSKRYEDYLLNELRGTVEKRYRVDTTRRSIAGLSMGGYGAILYALKRPDLFRFAGSLSGAIPFPRFMEDTVRQPGVHRLSRSLRAAFGSEPNAHRDSNDMFLLARSLDTGRTPYIYMATGIQDGFRGFLPVHRMFADTLRSAGIPYEFHETRGGHSWAYWGREIRPLVERMRKVLGF